MLFTKLSAVALAAASSVAAQSATVVIEASHGGAGNGLTNTTITVPLGTTYTDSALGVVSTLFLTGATGASLDSITCTPYKNANGTGAGGLPFNSFTPSFLSTNTVQVGSLICLSSANAGNTTSSTASSSSATTTSTPSVVAPSLANSTTSATTSSAVASSSALVSTVSNPTSVYLTTILASEASAPPQATITNVVMGGQGDATPTTTTGAVSAGGASGSTAASPSASLGAAACASRTMDGWVLPVVAGVGLLAMT